jgi:hypothetical protein
MRRSSACARSRRSTLRRRRPRLLLPPDSRVRNRCCSTRRCRAWISTIASRWAKTRCAHARRHRQPTGPCLVNRATDRRRGLISGHGRLSPGDATTWCSRCDPLDGDASVGLIMC